MNPEEAAVAHTHLDDNQKEMMGCTVNLVNYPGQERSRTMERTYSHSLLSHVIPHLGDKRLFSYLVGAVLTVHHGSISL